MVKDIKKAYMLLSSVKSRKDWNYLKSYISMLMGLKRSLGYPSIYIIEPTNNCDQKCTICETGLGLLKRTKGFMDYDKYCNLVDEIAPYAREVSLYWMGEPTLHKRFYDMVAYLKKKAPDCRCNLATDGNRLKPRLVIESGLDFIEFKFSGIDQKTHNAYRVGGYYENVLNNIRELVRLKREKGLKKPEISVGFIVMKFNEHQVNEYINFVKTLGVDFAKITKPTVRTYEQGLELLPTDRKLWSYDPVEFEKGVLVPLGHPKSGEKCEWLWDIMPITWDGFVTPCCWFLDKNYIMGNIFEEGLKKVWNDKQAMDFRKIAKTDEKFKFKQCREYCHSSKVFTTCQNTTTISIDLNA